MEPDRPASACSSNGAQHRTGPYGVIDGLRSTSVFSSLSSLFLSEKFSDLTITCQGRVFKAHQAIVCSQSPFFDKALSIGFKESTTGVIDLPDDDPDVVQLFLEYLYTGNYSDGVVPTHDKPASVALMPPKAIRRELRRRPGVEIDGAGSLAEVGVVVGSNLALTNEALGKVSQAAEEESDSEYESEEEDPSEPDEEYYEYSGAELDSDHNAEDNSKLAEVERQLEQADKDERPGLGKALAVRSLASLHRDLLLSMRLYVIASKYDVPALRLLARDRFYRAAELQWEFDDSFPDVVDELYSSTPETEVAMREIVCRLVGNRALVPGVRKKMERVMRKHGDFSVGVMNWLIERYHTGW